MNSSSSSSIGDTLLLTESISIITCCICTDIMQASYNTTAPHYLRLFVPTMSGFFSISPQNVDHASFLTLCNIYKTSPVSVTQLHSTYLCIAALLRFQEQPESFSTQGAAGVNTFTFLKIKSQWKSFKIMVILITTPQI